MNYTIKRIDDNQLKIFIMECCDSAFPIRLFERHDAPGIINRIINNAFFFAALDISSKTQKPMGYVAFYANDTKSKTAYITSIGVLKQYRGHQLGQILLETCFHISIESGMEQIRLQVLKTNKTAIHFYTKNGFTIESINSDGTFFMRRPLSESV